MSPEDPQQLEFLFSLDEDTDIVPWVNNLLQHDDHNIDSSDIASLEKQLSHIVPALEIASEDQNMGMMGAGRGRPRINQGLGPARVTNRRQRGFHPYARFPGS